MKQQVYITAPSSSLYKHYKKVKDVCDQNNWSPVSSHDAQNEGQIDELVRESSAVIAVLGFDCGPFNASENKYQIDLELEYARRHHKRVFVFFMSDRHPVALQYIEDGTSVEKLRNTRKELESNRRILYFDSVDDLGQQVKQVLSKISFDGQSFRTRITIPRLPRPFIAHPYPLLPDTGLIGRGVDLEKLDRWVLSNNVTIFSLIGIGGMGKSALTWDWFKRSTEVDGSWNGSIWWSFYEQSASFDNFVVDALAYFTETTPDDIRAVFTTSQLQRESLLQKLSTGRYLIVLDGMERILNAYSQSDVSRVADWEIAAQTEQLESEIGTISTDNISQHFMRLTQDPHVGVFLRQLAELSSIGAESKVLISSRLDIADLRSDSGDQLPGTLATSLTPFSTEDAFEFWKAMNLKGNLDDLAVVFQTFNFYPLLIRLLAGEVAKSKDRDFDQWRQANPQFAPSQLTGDLKKLQSHVLGFAVRDLGEPDLHVLVFIAAFSRPVAYSTLHEIAVSRGRISHAELARSLKDLEERGLIGWERDGNRYDMHPVVRGVALRHASESEQTQIYTDLEEYFSSVSSSDIKLVDDLNPRVEQFNSLVHLSRFADALNLYKESIHYYVRFKFAAFGLGASMIESLLPQSKLDGLWSHKDKAVKCYAFWALAEMYSCMGVVDRSTNLLSKARELLDTRETNDMVGKVLSLLCYNLSTVGRLFEAESLGIECVNRCRELGDQYNEGVALYFTMQIYILAENWKEIERIGDRVVAFLKYTGHKFDARSLEWMMANASMEFSKTLELTRGNFEDSNFVDILAAYAQGRALIELGRLSEAEEQLNISLMLARIAGSMKYEAECLNGLAEMNLERGNLSEAFRFANLARQLLKRIQDVWIEADSSFVLAKYYLATGDLDNAIAELEQTYRLAWCEGSLYQNASMLRKIATLAIEGFQLPVMDSNLSVGFARKDKLEVVMPASKLPEGISDTAKMTENEVEQVYIRVRELLDWANTAGTARKWWEAFEIENSQRKRLILRLAEELKVRHATITEFFLAYVYSNTDNIQANLHYLDYIRKKNEAEKVKREERVLDPTPEVDLTVDLDMSSLEKLKEECLYEAMKPGSSSRKWWEQLEVEKTRAQFIWILREIRSRKGTAEEFFLAYVYSNSEDVRAVFDYFDYSRLKKADDQKRKTEQAGKMGL